MYSLNQSQFFSPSLQQVSSNILRGSYKPFRQVDRRSTQQHVNNQRALQVEELALPEAARELTRIPKTQLKAILDEALAPGLKLFRWTEGKCLEEMMLWATSCVGIDSTGSTTAKSETKLSLNNQVLRRNLEITKPVDPFSPKFRLQCLYGNPQLQFNRGFKTKRSDSYTLPFQRKPSRDVDTKSVSIDPNLIASTLKQLNNNLTLDDKEKLNAAIHGYLLGKNEATKGNQGTAQTPVIGKVEPASKQDEITFKKGDVWNKLNKVATVLVIIAITLSLGQIFNIPFLRINRGNNEIAPEEIEVTFDDVKGCDEAKQELQEMVEFLMHPEKFSALGGKLPKGCLLVGPPGTGKTLLARAVAGQAGVPFFHAAGSEFDEVLVGQGARRVRDLFRAAKSRAPCVIFIDEIDSVGSKRTNSVLHPYANQTINQLLSEMDGFLPNEGVVVLGATNRAEDLDKALLRPATKSKLIAFCNLLLGRFDTQVVVPIPDMNGRKEILTLYLGKIKHDNSVDVDKLAKMTVGFSGADLENMVNTAAIRAAIEDKSFVTMSEFEYSHDKHVLGTDWKSRVRDKEDLKITAYHEAGHTLVAFFTEGSKPLHKVTIVAKGMTGGHTAFLPEKDSYHETKLQYLAQMDVAMGGRAAEELIFNKDNVTGGASHDLEQATFLAETMVKKLGMSEKIGLRVIPDNQGFSKNNDLGPGTYELIDTEVTRMLNDSYKRAFALLKMHRKELDLLAEALLNYETLDVEDIKAIVGGDQKSVSEKMAASNRILQLNKTKPVPGQTPQIGGKPDVLSTSASRLEA